MPVCRGLFRNEGAKVVLPFQNWDRSNVKIGNRLQLLLDGKMPVTKKLSYEWYETPNIHFCTIRDFITLCHDLDIKIKKRLAFSEKLIPGGVDTAWPSCGED